MSFPSSLSATLVNKQLKGKQDDGDSSNGNSRSQSSDDKSTQVHDDGPRPNTSLVSSSSTAALQPSITSQAVSATPALTSAATNTISPLATSPSLLPIATPVAATSSTSSPSRQTTLIIAVIGAGVGAAVLFFLVLYLYKISRLSASKRAHSDTSSRFWGSNYAASTTADRNPSSVRPVQDVANKSMTPNQRLRPVGHKTARSDTTSRVWGSSVGDSSTAEETPPFVHPFMQHADNDSASRHYRLGFVRNSLLPMSLQTRHFLGLESQRSGGRERGSGDDECVHDGFNDMTRDEKTGLEIEAKTIRAPSPITVVVSESRVERVLSVPRWRDALNWVSDQMERNRSRQM